jgi:hypothetical protein
MLIALNSAALSGACANFALGANLAPLSGLCEGTQWLSNVTLVSHSSYSFELSNYSSSIKLTINHISREVMSIGQYMTDPDHLRNLDCLALATLDHWFLSASGCLGPLGLVA